MLTKLFVITKYTFLDILKSKIFYITLIVGFSTMVMTYVATEFTYGVPEKVALDFGLGMLSISSLGISIFMGASLLTKEIESRTLYMVISRPVPRWVFISGKLLGLICVLIINLLILSAMILIASYLLGGQLSQMTFVAMGFNLVEAILLLLVVVLFSLFSNTILASIISLVILASGHAVKETFGSTFVDHRPALKMVLDFYHLVLPAFYKLNFKEYVIYSQSVDSSFVLQSLAYGFCYSGFLFFLIIRIFNQKNLD